MELNIMDKRLKEPVFYSNEQLFPKGPNEEKSRAKHRVIISKQTKETIAFDERFKTSTLKAFSQKSSVFTEKRRNSLSS